VIVGSIKEIGNTIFGRDYAKESTHSTLQNRRLMKMKSGVTTIGAATLTRFIDGVTELAACVLIPGNVR